MFRWWHGQVMSCHPSSVYNCRIFWQELTAPQSTPIVVYCILTSILKDYTFTWNTSMLHVEIPETFLDVMPYLWDLCVQYVKKPFNIVSRSTLENIYAFPFTKLVKKGLIRNYIDSRLPDFYHFILPKKVSLKHRSDLEEYMDPKIHIWIVTTLGYRNHTLKRLTCHKRGCNESDSSTTSAIQDISVAYMSLLNLRIYLQHYTVDMSCAGVRTWPMDRGGDVHTE